MSRLIVAAPNLTMARYAADDLEHEDKSARVVALVTPLTLDRVRGLTADELVMHAIEDFDDDELLALEAATAPCFASRKSGGSQ